MKKLILLLFILLSLSGFSQKIEFQCKEFSSFSNYCGFSGWKDSNVSIIWDIDSSRIIINSTIKQIIKYIDYKVMIHENKSFFFINGIDNNKINITVLINVWENNEDIFIHLFYPDIQFSYKANLLL